MMFTRARELRGKVDVGRWEMLVKGFICQKHKFWGANVPHGDYSKCYFVVCLKFAMSRP